MPDADFKLNAQSAASAPSEAPAVSFKDLQKLAKKDPVKMYELGLVYFKGESPSPDPEKDAKRAFECFEKSVKALPECEERTDAIYHLAMCHEKGIGTKNDYKEAFRLYTLTSNAGHVESKIKLGYLYLYGRGTKQSDIEAFNRFNEAAELGSVDGRIAVADCYLNQKGVPKADPEKAVEVYKELARTNVRAAYNFAYCYHTGKGVEKNTFMAGHYLVPAAKRGDVDAQCFLAQCFFKGDGVKRNLPKAAYWFKKAAAKGSDVGRFNYAYCLENGLGVNRDVKAAFSIYDYLYKKGYPRAASAAARCYYYGFGVKQSLKQAIECVKFGVKNGDAESLCYMGWFRLNGIKCRKNVKEAYKLFGQAYGKGSAAAAYALSVLVLKDVKKKKEEEAKAKSEEYRKFALDRKYPPALYELALGKEGRERAELLNEAAERDYIPAIVRYAKELEEEFPDRAFALWQRAYALGSLRGAYGMGRCYERGIGVLANREKAYVFYRQAAKSGYADAIAVVGMYYQKGCVVDMDAKLAEECYDVAIRKGSTYALRRMAKMYAIKGKIGKAEKAYGRAIAFGDEEAVLGLAEAYCMTGKKKYYKKALPILRSLVAEGEPKACALLAQVYDSIGTTDEAAEAADAMLQAGVNAHCANAYYYNALRMYESENAGDRDWQYIGENLQKAMDAGSDAAARFAVELYTKKSKEPGKAILAKDALIRMDLGDDYLYEVACAFEEGKVVDKDEQKAAFYFALAWKRGAKKGRKALKKLKKYKEYGGKWMTKKSAKKAAKAPAAPSDQAKAA